MSLEEELFQINRLIDINKDMLLAVLTTIQTSDNIPALTVVTTVMHTYTRDLLLVAHKCASMEERKKLQQALGKSADQASKIAARHNHG